MKYPIGIQDFEKLRTEGYIYVDKTALIYAMATQGCYYFLGRPRRFGKSLLISTLDAYFQGKKELFKGLAIEKLEQEWLEYPVLHIDFNNTNYNNPEGLNKTLDRHLRKFEKIYGKEEGEDLLELRFADVIQRAYEKTGRRVVVLIDEYDKPLLETIGDDELQEKYRKTLKAFFGNLKSQDKYIRFAFLTGVTKFGKVSVFSDLNNLEDISMVSRYAEICGITETELHRYFDGQVDGLAMAAGMTKEEAYECLRVKYDGYHFCEKSAGLYNPFSLLNAFEFEKIDDYWFATGTPTILAETLKAAGYDLRKLDHSRMRAKLTSGVEAIGGSPIPLLFQSGYLTIKGYDRISSTYTLGFPNKEVESGFYEFLLPFYVNAGKDTEFYAEDYVKDVRAARNKRLHITQCQI